ncbi:MAG: hypothetical protein ACI85O_000449 [Saprospiraceae bacterium]|jgi:hypothetical protein
MSDKSPNYFKTIPVEKLDQYNFFVDDYQRGYKWTPQQVKDLLDDIWSFDESKESFYCLQPLAIKQRQDEAVKEVFLRPNSIYEVIDGQQRLTTIYLIYTIIDNNHSTRYELAYQTRTASADFLKNISENLGTLDFQHIEKVNKKTWKKEWIEYINDAKSEYNNIDIYHFFRAYLTIKSWLAIKENKANENDGKAVKAIFLEKLRKHTRFIWYEDTGTDNSKKVFRNLNSGKIELTNAELIKALFINDLKNDNAEIQQLKQTELAMEWDRIEQALQDDAFWFFINNETDSNKYQTRIDFLFELIVGKSTDSKGHDRLYSYRQYADKTEPLDWKKIKNLFLKLQEWFEDRELYHLIGFLVYRNIGKIQAIIDIEKKVQKSELKNELKKLIKNEFSKTDKEKNIIYDLDTLKYNEANSAITTILLLFNIETYQKSEAQFRFPFSYLKNQKWSLEHIHAQNSKDIETYQQLDTRLNDIKKVKAELPKKKREDVKSIICELKLEIKKIENLQTKIPEPVLEKLKEIDKLFDLNKIKNLALLEVNTNSALGNKPFGEKRATIIRMSSGDWTDEKGKPIKKFIPICTKNVFLKYYSDEIDQLDYFGHKDRNDYLKNIKTTLSKYLTEKSTTDESN